MFSLDIHEGAKGKDHKRDHSYRDDAVGVNRTLIHINCVILKDLVVNIHGNIFIGEEADHIINDIRIAELFAEGVGFSKVIAADDEQVTVGLQIVNIGGTGGDRHQIKGAFTLHRTILCDLFHIGVIRACKHRLNHGSVSVAGEEDVDGCRTDHQGAGRAGKLGETIRQRGGDGIRLGVVDIKHLIILCVTIGIIHNHLIAHYFHTPSSQKLIQHGKRRHIGRGDDYHGAVGVEIIGNFSVFCDHRVGFGVGQILLGVADEEDLGFIADVFLGEIYGFDGEAAIGQDLNESLRYGFAVTGGKGDDRTAMIGNIKYGGVELHFTLECPDFFTLFIIDKAGIEGKVAERALILRIGYENGVGVDIVPEIGIVSIILRVSRDILTVFHLDLRIALGIAFCKCDDPALSFVLNDEVASLQKRDLDDSLVTVAFGIGCQLLRDKLGGGFADGEDLIVRQVEIQAVFGIDSGNDDVHQNDGGNEKRRKDRCGGAVFKSSRGEDLLFTVLSFLIHFIPFSFFPVYSQRRFSKTRTVRNRNTTVMEI